MDEYPWRDAIFTDSDAAYHRLWAVAEMAEQERAERALWDNTLMDGLRGDLYPIDTSED